jgi:hypothetical protein
VGKKLNLFKMGGEERYFTLLNVLLIMVFNYLDYSKKKKLMPL